MFASPDNVMASWVERIHRAARNANYEEIERVVHELVTIGLCDHERARAILERA